MPKLSIGPLVLILIGALVMITGFYGLSDDVGLAIGCIVAGGAILTSAYFWQRERNAKAASEPQEETDETSSETVPTVPFYKTKWFIILLLILFAPVGIYLLWKHWGDSRKASKWGLSILAGLIFLTLMIPTGDKSESDAGAIVDGVSSSITSLVPEEESSVPEQIEESSTVSEVSEEVSEPSQMSEEPSFEEPSEPAVSSEAPASSEISVSSQLASSSVSSDPQKVFWGKSGTKYHIDPDCRSFQGNTPNSGSLSQAKSAGRSDWCGICSKDWTDTKLQSEGNPFA